MKKIFSLAIVVMMTLVAFAQTDNKDFFAGKWSLTVQGLPSGDTEMVLEVVVNEDGTLTGTIGDAGGQMNMPLKSAIIDEEGDLLVKFNGQGFEVPIILERKEDGTVEGAMNDMFDITGKRYVKPE